METRSPCHLARARPKRAILAIAHTLLKIAYQVLKADTPYADLGAGYHDSRESVQARQDYLASYLPAHPEADGTNRRRLLTRAR